MAQPSESGGGEDQELVVYIHYRKRHLYRVSKIPGEGLKTPGEDFAVYNTRRRRHGKDLAGEESSPGVFFEYTAKGLCRVSNADTRRRKA
jgi:hypothetical protein